MTRKRIPCTLSSRVIGPSSHSGSLGRVVTLGKIGPMAFFFVHEKCQHYYESGHSSYGRAAYLLTEGAPQALNGIRSSSRPVDRFGGTSRIATWYISPR